MKAAGMLEQTGRKLSEIPGEMGFHKPVLDVIWDVFGDERVILGATGRSAPDTPD